VRRARAEKASSRERGLNPKRPTHAQSLARQREIATDRDVELLSWREIAQKHAMGEKEVREAYRRYRDEIMPIFAADATPDRGLVYLQMLGTCVSGCSGLRTPQTMTARASGLSARS
jgi:hypothetical protein